MTRRFLLHDDAPVPNAWCTNCRAHVDAANLVEENPQSDEKRVVMPDPGSVTVCSECGHVMVFTDDLRLRDPTEAEAVKIAADPRLIAAQRAIALAKILSKKAKP